MSRVALSLLVLLLASASARGAEVAGELGDPTRPPSRAVVAPERAAALVLSAIYWAPEKPSAVVDGRRVGVGDPVGAFVVAAIERDAVRLQGAGGFVELRLGARVRRARGDMQ